MYSGEITTSLVTDTVQLWIVPALQVTAVAQGGHVMPPKSTFFAPKPRSGIFLTDRRHPPAAYNRLQD